MKNKVIDKEERKQKKRRFCYGPEASRRLEKNGFAIQPLKTENSILPGYEVTVAHAEFLPFSAIPTRNTTQTNGCSLRLLGSFLVLFSIYFWPSLPCSADNESAV